MRNFFSKSHLSPKEHRLSNKHTILKNTFFAQIRCFIQRYLQTLSSQNLILMILGYIALSWALLMLSEETHLTHSPSELIYYLLVTASTVGYGDLSPVTSLGKWSAALFIIPCGIGLFAIVIGRVATMMIVAWQSALRGDKQMTMKSHILILGWHPQRTLHLIAMLQHEEARRRNIVLCVQIDMENPLPGEIEFVRVRNFTDHKDMQRTNLSQASCIIINHDADDITLSTALYCSNQNPTAHLLAYFNDESLSQLLQQHCPNVECIPSVSTEMIAKAAVDPGSSRLHQELLSTHKGMTQYCLIYPKEAPECSVEQLFIWLKQHYDATLIAVEDSQDLYVNPPGTRQITADDRIHYIADERIEPNNWSSILTIKNH